MFGFVESGAGPCREESPPSVVGGWSRIVAGSVVVDPIQLGWDQRTSGCGSARDGNVDGGIFDPGEGGSDPTQPRIGHVRSVSPADGRRISRTLFHHR